MRENWRTTAHCYTTAGDGMHSYTRNIVIIFLLTFFAVQSRAKVLDTLVIEGAEIHSEAVIRNSIPLRTGKEFSATDVQESIRNLHHLGLFDQTTFFVTAETDSGVSMRLKVTENPAVESIEISGNKKLKERDLQEEITLRTGQVVGDAALYKSVREIKEAYAEEGYLQAQVETELVETATPGNVIVRFKIEENERVRVEEITFTGNEAFSERRLKRKLKTKENKWYTSGDYDEDLFQRHLDTLMMYYHNKGYLDAEVAQDSVWYGDEKKDIFIRIDISEGPLYYVGDFYFTGNKVLDTDKLKSNIAMKEEKPFSRETFEATKMFLANAYREEGYLWVQLQDEFRYRDDTIDVVFSIQEGRPALVRKIDIEGNQKTHEKVIRRELKLYPGQKYRQSGMERSIREVMALNFFSNVTPDLRPNEDGTIDLVVNTEEKENIGQFSAGVMYSEVDRFGGNFNISIPNFRGRGQRLDANVEVSKFRQDFRLGFTEPWILDNPISGSAEAFWRRLVYQRAGNEPDDEIISYGTELGVGRRLKWPDDYFRVYANYRISKEQESVSRDTVGNFRVLNDGILSKLSLTLERNDTDVPNFPTSGSRFVINSQFAGLGGDYQYWKGSVGYDWYFPLFWKFVLGLKAKYGLMGPFGDMANVSYLDFFSAGGVFYGEQLRGYKEEAFGGRNYRYTDTPGITALTMSSEIRFPVLPQQLYLGVFGDMGNVWDDPQKVSLTDMHKGVGFGLRLLFPMIGLLGFDFAWGLDNPDQAGIPDDYNKFEFHFMMNKGY